MNIMGYFLGIIALLIQPMFYAIIGYFVIKLAVKSALREYDQEKGVSINPELKNKLV